MSNDDRNEDWLKGRTWDVHMPDGTPVRTLTELRSVFPGVSNAHFASWPSMRVAPEPIRRALGIPAPKAAQGQA